MNFHYPAEKKDFAPVEGLRINQAKEFKTMSGNLSLIMIFIMQLRQQIHSLRIEDWQIEIKKITD